MERYYEIEYGTETRTMRVRKNTLEEILQIAKQLKKSPCCWTVSDEITFWEIPDPMATTFTIETWKEIQENDELSLIGGV